MPAGADVTTPPPAPAVPTVSAYVGMTTLKLAVTFLAASIDTVHVVDVPLHAPAQPPNVLLAPGVAASVTRVPVVNGAEHVEPQLMPAGLDVTAPVPLPVVVTPSACVCSANVAVTLFAALIVTVHGPVPLQAPDQPVNVLLAFGAAVSVTVVPLV